jgi:hypothetical protein
MNRSLIFKTTQTLLMAVGGTGMIAFAATLQWWLMLIGAGVVSGTWFLIYKLLESIALPRTPMRNAVTFE